MTAETLEDTGQVTTSDSPRGAPVPSSAARNLLTGTSALGTAVLLERGFGFLANLLAARLGGASTFGTYSFAITTANNVSTYAAGGIASTAIRFSGRYGRGTAGYNTLAKALTIIATVSAALGALVLWAGAAPLARVLGKSALTSLLEWTALSVAGMILLECCRGFLVGQRQIRGILLLSLTVGLGMVVFIPLLARVGPAPMIAAQGTIATGAVLLCVLFIRPWRADEARATAGSVRLGPVLREVWSFGLVQLAGLISLNAAGWWLTSLLARADTSMRQMGFFAIACQLRNVVSLAPSLLIETSLSVMSHEGDGAARTPEWVMAFCTWAATFAALALAGPAIAVLPWALPLLYGRAYCGATAAVAIALVTAVIHMGSGPTSARLSILSIRTSGMINTIWAAVVALAAATFLLWGGDAAKAALIYLAAHLISAALLWIHLRRRCSMPRGMGEMYITGAGVAFLLALFSTLRDGHPEAAVAISGLLLVASAGGLIALTAIARRENWLPNASQCKRLFDARWRNRRGRDA